MTALLESRFIEEKKRQNHQYIAAKRHRINARREELRRDKVDAVGVVFFLALGMIALYVFVGIGGCFR